MLSAADYLALLTRRLQAHPMYLEGMAFPVASSTDGQDGDGAADDEKMPLVVLVLDTRWDPFGVFASVIDEVRQGYELAPALLDAQPAAGDQPRAPLAGDAGRLRRAALSSQ